MRIVYSFTAYFTKITILSLFIVFLPAQRSMAMEIAGSDGKSFTIPLQDAKKLDAFNKIIKENGDGCFKVECPSSFAGALGVLFQCLAGMPVQYLSDKNGAESFQVAIALRAPEDIVEKLEKELFIRSFATWHARLHGKIPAEVQPVSCMSLVDVQKKAKRGKLDLSSNHLETLRGCVLTPSQIQKIKEMDLSFNRLTLVGCDAMRPLQLFGQLMKLNMANNQLDHIPAHFFANLPNCAVISLANNKIDTIDTDAFAGARNCVVNLCGNPLTTIDPDALTGGQRKLIVLCSKRLPENVQSAINEQLNEKDFTHRSLTKVLDCTQKLSSFEGCTPFIVLVAAAGACSIVLFPIFWFNQIDPTSPKAVCIAASYTLITLALYYNLLSIVQKQCAKTLENKGNRVMFLDRQEAQRKQYEMFAS